METLCATRSLKILKYLHRMVPKTIPRSSLDALEKLPSSVLFSLHTASDWAGVTKDEKLKNWLSINPIPAPQATVSGALFNGTLVFPRIVFARPNQPDFSVSMADMQTAVNYATLAVVPIRRCASQYGPNSVTVSPTIIPHTANLTGNSFSQDDLEGWVEQVAQTARANQVTNPCIVILHDRSLPTSPMFTGDRHAHHWSTHNGTPYCYCLVFGQNLSVADNNHTINGKTNEKVYAHILSHEIAEMVVDPVVGINNPEVCDACSTNCNPFNLFDLFDQNGVFIGGTNDTASATGFSFFINSVVRPDAYDPATQCVVPGGDTQSACIYAPPLEWGQGILTTVNNPVSVAGHFSSSDGRHLVVVGTSTGKIHEIFWQPAQVGIEGEDDLPVAFDPGTIGSVATIYNIDQQRHIVLVGTTAGKVHEIFWKPDTVGIEGDDDLPVNFATNSIVAVTGLYDNNQQRHVVLVGTTAGKVHEIFWKADTVGIEGHDDLPVTFTPGSIVAVTAFYNSDSDQQRYVVVVGTTAGKLHEIFWKADTVGIEGHDDLPVDFGSGSIVALSGFYDSNQKRYVVAVGTRDGTVHQVYWKATTVGIEAHSTVAKFSPNSIVSLAAFYSVSDNINHIVVALSNGQLREFWVKPDI
jgi:hypothetical protein